MRILLIDHVWTEGLLLGQELHLLGHEVVVALEPERAMAALAEDGEPVHAVIVGVEADARSSLSLARRIRHRHPDKPVAFRTGPHPDSGTLRAVHALGPVLLGSWAQRDVEYVVAALTRMRQRWSARPAAIATG